MAKETKRSIQERVAAIESELEMIRPAALRGYSMAHMHERLVIGLIRKTGLTRGDIADLVAMTVRGHDAAATSEFRAMIDRAFDLATGVHRS